MPLVDYADSDESGADENQSTPKPQTGSNTPSKPAFQKVVDRTNPHKVRVNLPEFPKKNTGDDGDEPEPPAKRAKVGSGGFSGFNSLLPAPKRAGATNGGLANGSRKGGLGSGVNLKTGATPGFSREVEPNIDGTSEEVANSGNEEVGTRNGVEVEKDHEISSVAVKEAPDKQDQEPKKRGNPVMFKPLSVARKPQRKKKVIPTDAQGANTIQEPSLQSRVISKVSLFSIGDVQEPQNNTTAPKGEYKPMVYQMSNTNTENSPLVPNANLYQEDNGIVEEPIVQISATLPDTPQSLDTIAADLNLSASAKRQLFGRNGKNPSATNIVNFNTDQEYAANEILRQNGEQVQHNPVRAIAAGKHSLKQLVNAASNQKDALEEHFASGRRNKKEAGSKYGW